jgi:glycosyltransferase involved in cell wall biosynthesis
MKIAIAGQTSLRQLADRLDQPAAAIPRGLGGTPPLHEIIGLLARGHDVSLVTLDPDVTNEMVLHGDQLTVHVGPFRRRRAARNGYRSERQFVADALQRCRPEVVHAHWTYEYALGALASGLPTMVTAHDAPLVAMRHHLPTTRMGPLVSQMPSAAHWLIRAAMAAVVTRRAPRLVAVSPYIEQHFRRAMRYQGDIVVVPNLLPTLLSPSVRRELIPNARTPGSHTIFITVLTTWSALKNGAAAIRAFAEARARLADASLKMIGEGFGPDGPAERWANERRLASGISFVGPLRHDLVLEEIATADILVHPSLEESYGSVIGEAQLAGVPVIGGARSGAVPWALDYNRAGRLVDVRSASSIAAAMVELALDRAARSSLARAGADLVRRRHDPDRLIASIEALLAATAS